MLERGQPIIHNLQPLSRIPFLQRIFRLKQYILGLDIPVHDIAVSQVLNPLKDLLDDTADLVWLELFFFLPVLDLLIERDAL